MTNPHAADTAVGERLRKAREAAGYSLADVSARSRMPIRVLEKLESGDWTSLGAPVFVRGHVRSYGRVLGLTLEDQSLPSPLTTSQIPSLVSHAHTPRYRHVAENLVRRAVYVVLTVALVVPVWLATRSQFHAQGPAIEPLDPPAAVGSAPVAPEPMVASIVPSRAPTPAPGEGLVLQFGGESWVQVFDARGAVVEKGLVRAGERRELAAGARVVLGNAAAVEATHGGEAIDLAPFSQANVARFTLSSDGSLAPIARP
jgi:cytoskeleton protein RodZ